MNFYAAKMYIGDIPANSYTYSELSKNQLLINISYSFLIFFADSLVWMDKAYRTGASDLPEKSNWSTNVIW